MYPTAPDLTGRTDAYILPWADPSVDGVGHDPRSQYAETFWLPILGPSTLWLLRHVAMRFDVEPEGFTLDLDEASSALGIRSKGGRNNAFQRSIGRSIGFSMGRVVDDATLEVRRVMPWLHGGQVRRLSTRRQRLHQQARDHREEQRREDGRRAASVASTLLQLGDSPDLVEQQLVSWGVEPRTARTAVNAAWADKARRDAVVATDAAA